VKLYGSFSVILYNREIYAKYELFMDNFFKLVMNEKS
jgi:hypothetical protein